METIKTFWHWYISLFSDADNKVRIGAWAATVATVSFLTTVVFKPFINKITRKFSKVKVEAGMSHQIVSTIMGTTTIPPLLTISVTNLSGAPIFINNPSLTTSRKIDGNNKFVVPKNVGVFPRKLENGEVFKQDYDTVSLNNQLLSTLSDHDRIGFTVTTTSGKNYKSNKFSKKHILGHMQAARQMR